jgi:hypothetical protein
MGIAPPGPAQEPTVATQRDGRDPPRVSKDDRPGDGSPESPDSWGILTTHATQLGALGVGLFLLMKTYSVSHYSLTTASALLTAAPVGVILGTLTSYEYMLWPLMSVAAGLLAARLWNREGLSVACLGAGGLSAASALLSLPLYLAIGGVAVVAACVAQAALARAVGRDEAGAPPAWLPSRYTAVRSHFVAVIIVLLTVSLPNAWLPAEIVVFHGANGERRVVVGHVVGTGDGWMTVLRGGDHGLTRVRASRVAARRVCHLGGAQPKARRPMALVITGRPYDSPNVGCRPLLGSLAPACLVDGSFPAAAPYRGAVTPSRACTMREAG